MTNTWPRASTYEVLRMTLCFMVRLLFDPLTRLFDARVGKTIVYIPAVSSSSSLGGKDEDVKGVLGPLARPVSQSSLTPTCQSSE